MMYDKSRPWMMRLFAFTTFLWGAIAAWIVITPQTLMAGIELRDLAPLDDYGLDPNAPISSVTGLSRWVGGEEIDLVVTHWDGAAESEPLSVSYWDGVEEVVGG